MKNTSQSVLRPTLFDRLKKSSLFQTYQRAYEAATGLPLMLKPAGESEDPDPDCFRNRFCALLNEDSPCANCVNAEQNLTRCSEKQAHTKKCFAGLRETAVPIRSGGVTVAFITTGQVFDRQPRKADFTRVAGLLRESGFSSERTESLRSAYMSGEVVESERYQGMVNLLAVFALQLSDSLNRLMIEDANAEPAAVAAAKRFINANLEERITLDAVAAHVCVSSYYFCKIFKQATGMTLTEYVNRRRVEWAKRKLLNPQVRVTEVAYDVGYQSLSQFNRSFLKYAGMSPTEFRERSQSGAESAAVSLALQAA